MKWFTREQHGRSTHGEAIVLGAVTCAFAGLAMVSPVSAQTPVVLPTQHVTLPTNSYTSGQTAKISGLIVSRNGDDMTLRDDNGAFDVVTLTDDTKISSPSGLFNMDKTHRDVTSLLPGLIVEVKGTGGDRGNLVADKISFRSSALRVAQQIAAGTLALSHRVDANKASQDRINDSLERATARVADSLDALTARTSDSLAAIDARFDNLDNYDMSVKMSVSFATGSDVLSDNDKAQLDAMVDRAMQLKSYLIEVTGYADATGSTSLNQLLSDRRADAVVQYLTQVKNVPIRRILNPTGFGETQPVASNGTASGRAMNRRAEVRVLVNKAVQQ